MLDQVLQDYEQLREKHANERLKEARERKEDYQLWFQHKREDSIRRKQEAEMRRQIEMQKMEEKRQQVEKALETWKVMDQLKIATKLADQKERTLQKSLEQAQKEQQDEERRKKAEEAFRKWCKEKGKLARSQSAARDKKTDKRAQSAARQKLKRSVVLMMNESGTKQPKTKRIQQRVDRETASGQEETKPQYQVENLTWNQAANLINLSNSAAFQNNNMTTAGKGQVSLNKMIKGN